MSLSSTNNRNDYVGNGNVDTYAYSFRIFDETDLLVTVRNTSDVETTLVLTTDYTVTGVGDAGGGNVVLVNSGQAWLDGGGDLLTNYALTIRRVRPLTQTTDIRNQGSFFPETHEDSFDHAIMIAQQLDEALDRSVKLSETITSSDFDITLPTDVTDSASAGKCLIVNDTYDGFELGATSDEIANAQTYATAASASASAASASASAASASASAAATSASNAATSETNAAASAVAAAASAASPANDSVTNAALANMATQTIKGRTTAGTGDPEDLTATQATAILNNMVGDSGAGGTKGLVPAPAAGDAAASKFLKADGTWATAGSAGGLANTAPVVKSADYTLVSGDDGKTILVDVSSTPITITLPSATSNYKITIKDYKGYATINPITVERANASEKIDFALGDDVITESYGTVSYISDGTDWYRITKYTGSSVAARGIFMGGLTGADVNTVDYISIVTTSNATDFGDTSVTRHGSAGLGSSARGHAAGGSAGGASNVIDYFTFMSLGNGTDFGDLSVSRYYAGGCGSSTRGLIAGGDTGAASNVIDYITYATLGNATDFGDLTLARSIGGGSNANSPTRAVFGGGGYAGTNVIDYVTIASTGNATDFGDLSVNRNYASGAGSSTRGLFMGGETATAQNVVDYITIASTGNATDFGDLSAGRFQMGAVSSELRAVTGGGIEGGAVNTMDYFTTASTGNATDFGDLTQARRFVAGASNGHGGLQ